MRYFYFDLDDGTETTRHIMLQIAEAGWVTFPDVDSNQGPERAAYLAWIADGNTPELWQPDLEN